jgi:hypothetical protein
MILKTSGAQGRNRTTDTRIFSKHIQHIKQGLIMGPMYFLDRYQPYVLAILKIVTALIFMEHGTQKLFGFHWRHHGICWGSILFGIFARPVAFLLSGEMAVAYWMFHARGAS